MRVSRNLQNFTFGAFLRKIHALKCEISVNGFVFIPASFSFDELRELLKIIDLKYPRDEYETPISYAKISEQALLQHIEFLTAEIMLSGVYDFLKEEREKERK